MVGSPLASVCAAADIAATDKLRTLVTRGAALHSESALDRDRFWNEVHALLGQRGSAGIHVFQGLGEDAVRAIVARGHVIECSRGDTIIKRGHATRTVFVVLAGALEVRDGDRVLGVAGVGDVVGEVAFLLATARSKDVVAAEDGTRVLSLSERSLRECVRSDSQAGSALLLNLARALAWKLLTRDPDPL
jgi:hypothetical protein